MRGEISILASGSIAHGDIDAGVAEPAGGAADLVASAGGGGIDALGVFYRGEFFGSIRCEDHGVAGLGDGVEDELFEFDRRWVFRA